MPEFKLNGKTYSGSTNYASAISYTEDDGSKTTVQDKIDELNSNLPFKFGIDGDGNYGYYGADDSLIPFKISGKNIAFIEVQATTYTTGWTKIYWFNAKLNTIGAITVYLEKAPKKVTLFDKIIISYNSFKSLDDSVQYIKSLNGSNWTLLSNNSSTSVSLTGTGSSQFITFICD